MQGAWYWRTRNRCIFFCRKSLEKLNCNQTDGTYILCRKLIQEVLCMKNTKLTVTFYVGGKQVDKLTEEQKERMAQRLSEAMSIYYTAHIDEFKKIKN